MAQQLTSGLPQGDAPAPLAAAQLPKSGEQAHCASGGAGSCPHRLPAIRRGDADYFALLVGNYSLGGGGFVSRLMQEVREKRGYAYSVYSYFLPLGQSGPFQIGLQTKKSQANAALK